ncbi:MAG: serine dehydratase subunit alpha family protein [Chthonomonadales bacterium]|nr:serine dehydratase subunit alpha family protein [Chthonomonadales bacterium]
MTLYDILDHEWRPALGCTEPASVAYAAALAGSQHTGPIERIELLCDSGTYKNCFAVGIPNSGRKAGIHWAPSLGAQAPEPTAGLEIFRQITPEHVALADDLIQSGRVTARVDRSHRNLYVDCTVRRADGWGRAVLEDEHTRLIALERDGAPIPLGTSDRETGESVRAVVAGLSFSAMIEMATGVDDDSRRLLAECVELNLAIARHGATQFPERFLGDPSEEGPAHAGRMVCAGVYARMSGESMTVASLAGSGNKGITVAVPLALASREVGRPAGRGDEALALASLVTIAVTHHLGSLSAVCGCSNAAGIGLAAGYVHLNGGDAQAVSCAVTNMVGNVTGMICDGAKIGCGLKTMSSVDAAFRAASLACAGVAIPASDGIVGADGLASLLNLGRIANNGMVGVNDEVLDIMADKLERSTGQTRETP